MDNALINGRTFYRNEEVFWKEKFELYDQDTGEWHWNYLLDTEDSVNYIVTDEVVMETNVFSNTGTSGEPYKVKYDRKVQEDEATKIIGKNDYVEAGKKFLGVDISPYDTPDKADYADQYLLPKEYRRK